MKTIPLTSRFAAVLLLAITISPLAAADWPYWLGPMRNGSSPETGLLTTWPVAGPKMLWKVVGGDGYSTVAVSMGKAVTLVQHDGAAFVLGLDAANGTKLWETRVAGEYKNQYGDGPRSTPTFDGKKIYVQLPTGPLACLAAENGEIVWSVDLLKEFGAKNITWGLSASPFVDGGLVYALAGGKGAGVVALDKMTGKLVWKTGDDKPGYATPMPITVDGKKQIVFFTASGLLATSPDQGKELWRVPWTTEFDCNICTPLPIGKDQLFVTSGEENGCAMYKLAAAGPNIVWESKGKGSVMMNYWANSVVSGGYLYGISGEFNEMKMDLNCVDLNTGDLKWSKKNFGKAAITLADGHLFITTKKGDLVLVAANPAKYEEKARVRLLGENRTSPTIADKRLYLRDRQNIYCLDIAK
jgi:outer membrane protein assembly factor BamB